MSGLLQKGETINFELLLKSVAGLPWVRIDREKFLESALRPYYSDDVVKKAIEHNPAYAGISVEKIDTLANSSIRFETRNVSAISFAAGLPGGLAMAGTIPADLAQWFGHILRILQKLIYLYGWPELFDDSGGMDDETANLLTLFVGVMFGVAGAANAIAKVADAAAARAAKVIAKKALMKGWIYPIVKKVAGALGIRMTKDIFAKGVSKMIPVLGGVTSAGLTFSTFRPMAVKLRDHLSTLKFADIYFYANEATKHESVIVDESME